MSELKPCPFCKCTEIDAGKDYTRSYYRVDCLGCSAFITAPSLELAIQYWNTRPIEDELRAELARRDEIIKQQGEVSVIFQEQLSRRDEIITRLKEDAERLASTYVVEVFPHEWVCRGGCHHWARFGEQIDHAPDCPITLHRALMKELE